MRAIFPGSFDPITFGHLDLLRRAGRLFDEVVVAIGANPEKPGLLDPEERRALLTELFEAEAWGGRAPRIVVFDDLLVECAAREGCDVVVRGLRNGTDFDYEFAMAHCNRAQRPQLETVCLLAAPEWSFVSSRRVREILVQRGDASALVPEPVLRRLREKGRRAE